MIVAALLSFNAVAQIEVEANGKPLSGARMLPACKEYMKEEPKLRAAEIFCSAVVLTVMATSNFDGAYLICIPKGATLEMGLQVVVSALDSHPEILDQDFTMLAIYILNKTWPCESPLSSRENAL